MAAEELRTEFCERENSKLFAFIAFLNGIKNAMAKLPAIVHRLANKLSIFKPVKNIFLTEKIPKERRQDMSRNQNRIFFEKFLKQKLFIEIKHLSKNS
jgi:hypothetical protein